MPHHPRLSEQLSRDQVAAVVHRFYQRLRAEPRLAGYFAGIIHWDEHEAYLTDFWWGVMGGRVNRPRPNAMEQGHRDLTFGHRELALWLELFEQTLHELLPAETARQWDALARQIGHRMNERGLGGDALTPPTR